jgi:LysM repeat protein
MKGLMVLLSLLLLFELNAQNAHELNIEMYKDIAIDEMHRTGIPASIKLAQGILESNAGRSYLATKGNNHFGVKCGGDWQGESVFRKDDDYKNGRLVKSCFRKYANPEESYIAHSEFLRDPKKNYRYGFLFRYPVTDYKSWAHGLKKAGYATNKKYPQLLIDLIERYQLHQYDEFKEVDAPEMLLAEGYTPQVEMVNHVQYVYALKDETPEKLSLDFAVSVDRILKYNERIVHPNQMLKVGERVFLQRKRSSYRGKQKFHYVKAGETMFDIAQKYGLRLSSLLKKNKMEKGQEPAVGEQVKLKGLHWFAKRPVLRNERESILPNQPDQDLGPDEDVEAIPGSEEANDNSDAVSDPVTRTPAPSEDSIVQTSSRETPDHLRPNESIKKRFYTVQKGDTLYSISRHFNLELSRLKDWNELESNNISVGQVLRVH